MKKNLIATFVLLVTFGIIQCGGPGTIPEMKDFVNSFGSKDKLTAAINKYGTPETIPEAMKACDLEKPIITKTEKKSDIIYYTAEARVAKCDKSENAVGTIRIFTIGWKGGKIVHFKWGGPKSGNVEY